MNGVGYDALAAGTILGWVEIVKRWFPSSWLKIVCPVSALLLAQLYVWCLDSAAEPTIQKIGRGLILGFAAGGAFSTGKNATEAVLPKGKKKAS
jgi:hypothetical protein